MHTLPGDIAHTDIMISSIPSLISQMVEFLSWKKFYYASFFIDDKSDFTFAYHQESTSADDTILAKRAYEAELRKYSKKVQHYYANNETHTVAKYEAKIKDKKQLLIFCSTGSYYQNGKAETRIKIIYNPAHCMLINAMYR